MFARHYTACQYKLWSTALIIKAETCGQQSFGELSGVVSTGNTSSRMDTSAVWSVPDSFNVMLFVFCSFKNGKRISWDAQNNRPTAEVMLKQCKMA